jgi:ComEC/Rec2-related protein
MLETIAWDDLRRLPEAKTLETTQWRGVITTEPTASTSPSRRALARTSFTLSVDGWRPTGGRLFGAAIDAPWQPARGLVACTLLGRPGDLATGDRIEFAGAIAPPMPPLAPGELDFPATDAQQGIYEEATIPPPAWRRTEQGAAFWSQLSFRARDWAYRQLHLGLEDDPSTADFLAGMLIGYRQEIPAEIEQDFRRTGTLHVFAVSGQNIAEMLVVLIVLLQLCGLVRWRWAWATAPLVLLYCLLTGSAASAIRATVMALAVLLAWRIGRPLGALACWSLTFLAMLVWHPATLLDPGAQLSFGVVLGLILLGPPLFRPLSNYFRPDPFLPRDLVPLWARREEWFWQRLSLLLAASVAAALVSEPITAVAFHQITPISVFANLVVVPAAGLITVVGTIALFVSALSPWLAGLLNNANWLFARLLILFVHWLAHEPGASINVADLRAAPAPALLVAPVQDTGCLLVRLPGGGAWLVNAGREAPARFLTSRLLQFEGVNRLDAFVLAQRGVADNGGADVIARDFPPARLILPGSATRSPLEKDLPGVVALAQVKPEGWTDGSAAELAPGWSVEALNPPGGDLRTQAQDRALALLFRADGGTLLWAGKLSPAAQAQLLTAHPGLRADVLVLAADAAPSTAWLAALQVKAWLQLPPRDPRLNTNPVTVLPPGCTAWPLNQTGAVEIHFQPAHGAAPPLILLRPWVSGP